MKGSFMLAIVLRSISTMLVGYNKLSHSNTLQQEAELLNHFKIKVQQFK